MPDSVAQQMVDALESEVDFHRDLRRGDSFRVIYEALYASGEYVRPGRLLAVEFVNAGTRVDAYWHDDGSTSGSAAPIAIAPTAANSSTFFQRASPLRSARTRAPTVCGWPSIVSVVVSVMASWEAATPVGASV